LAAAAKDCHRELREEERDKIAETFERVLIAKSASCTVLERLQECLIQQFHVFLCHQEKFTLMTIMTALRVPGPVPLGVSGQACGRTVKRQNYQERRNSSLREYEHNVKKTLKKNRNALTAQRGTSSTALLQGGRE